MGGGCERWLSLLSLSVGITIRGKPGEAGEETPGITRMTSRNMDWFGLYTRVGCLGGFHLHCSTHRYPIHMRRGPQCGSARVFLPSITRVSHFPLLCFFFGFGFFSRFFSLSSIRFSSSSLAVRFGAFPARKKTKGVCWSLVFSFFSPSSQGNGQLVSVLRVRIARRLRTGALGGTQQQ
jgi:hypothetical protein